MISEKYLRRYCCEDPSKIENYEEAIADTTQIWDCHHRAEILPCGRFSIEQVKKHGLYWNRPASELVFLPHSDHFKMHLTGNDYTKGKHLSDEHKAKLSAKLKGRKCGPRSEEWRRNISAAKKGKKIGPYSEEHRRKLSEAQKGHTVSAQTREKISEKKSKSNTGRIWTTDGVSEKFVLPSDMPKGWRPGRVFKHRKKKSHKRGQNS